MEVQRRDFYISRLNVQQYAHILFRSRIHVFVRTPDIIYAEIKVIYCI